MKRLLFVLLLVSTLCLGALAEPVPTVYKAAGVTFTLHPTFGKPSPLGSGAFSLSYPSSKKPKLELILHNISAAAAKKIQGNLLAHEKKAFLGLSKPGEWTTECTILGQTVTVDGQRWAKGVAQSCLVPLGNGNQLFLALRANDPIEQGEPEQVWAEFTQTLKK